MTLFHSCDDVFEGTKEYCCHEVESIPGTETYLPIIVNNLDQVEGTGCLSITVPPEIWNAYAAIRNGPYFPGNMDLSAEPTMRFRVLQRNAPSVRAIDFSIVTRDDVYEGWNGRGYGDIGSDMTLGEWMEFEIDLRIYTGGAVLPTELEKVAGVYLTIHANSEGVEVLVDGFETFPASTPPPLSIALTPESAIVDEGSLVTLSASIYGGIEPYQIEWFVNNVSVQIGDLTYTFFADSSGTYEIKATVIDNDGLTTSATSTINVLAPLPPPEPCRPIHCSGNKILTDQGNQIHLRGATVEGFADSPNGNWLTKDGVWHWGLGGEWHPEHAQEHMEGIWSWRANCTRTHNVVGLWINNTGSMIENYKEFLTICHQLGIYVIVDFFAVVPYGQAGSRQTSIPFPPYLNAEEQALLDAAVGHPWTDQDFVDFYAWVANELKAFPNVIFEFWNEPTGDATAEASWMDVTQRCIDAIRAQGIENVILVQWAMNTALGYSTPTPDPQAIFGGFGMEWAFDYPLTDPLNNLLYSTHVYRYFGSPGYYSSTGTWADRLPFYRKNDLKQVMEDSMILEVARNHPLIIAEIGMALDGSFAGPDGTGDAEAEAQGLGNFLEICNEHKIGYVGWWFRPDGTFRLVQSGVPGYIPTESGTILIEKMMAAPPEPSIPILPLLLVGGVVLLSLGKKK